MSSSVVVITHKPRLYLERCLASVAGQADELVVVDNASEGDGASRAAERYGARYVRMSSNVGFAAGVNAGVAASAGEHVALLNDDAFAEPGWIAGSVATLADPTIAAVAPKLLFAWPMAIVRIEDPVRFRGSSPTPRGRHVTSVEVGGVDVLGKVVVHGTSERDGDGFWTSGAALLELPLLGDSEEVRVNGESVELETRIDLVNNAGSFLHTGGFCGDIGFGDRDNGAFESRADRFAACGAAMAFRRETWDRLGGFAEEFFAYYEDTDWSWRAQLAGMRVVYEPSLIVRHVHGTTGGPGHSGFEFFVARNRVLCMVRNAPTRVAVGLLSNLPPMPVWGRRSLAKRLPAALAHRRRMSREAALSREEVWARWAGVNVRQ